MVGRSADHRTLAASEPTFPKGTTRSGATYSPYLPSPAAARIPLVQGNIYQRTELNQLVEVPPQVVNSRVPAFSDPSYLLACELDNMGDPADKIPFAFSGRRGTLPLSDFIGMYRGAMSEKRYRIPGFTQRTAFEFLGPYLRDDPLKLYNRQIDRVMGLTEFVPARPAVAGVLERLERFGREEIPAILDNNGNVVQPGVPELPYLPYIAPVAPVEALPAREQLIADPLAHFFDMLRSKYRLQNPDQVRDLKQFTRRPNESATQMRSRMQNLLEALPGLMSDNDAALLYLAQFPWYTKHMIQNNLVVRRGDTNFSFLEATQEAIEHELNQAVMDSRDPNVKPGRSEGGSSTMEPASPPVRSANKSDAGSSTKRKPQQHRCRLSQASISLRSSYHCRCHSNPLRFKQAVPSLWRPQPSG